MKITLNGQNREIGHSMKLEEVIAKYVGRRHCLVEVNEEIIKNTRWNDIVIKDGDKLEVIHVVGGG